MINGPFYTDQMDGDHHGDHSRVLHLLSVVSGHHNIANVTLPWLLNYLHKLSSTAYSEETLENAIGVVECMQSIVEHLSVLCDDGDDDIKYFKPFLLDMLKLYIEPTLNGDNIVDPHVLTNTGVLNKFSMLLRVGIQGVNRYINILEYAVSNLCCSKMRMAVVKATKQTFWSLMESSDGLSFNPFDVSLLLCCHGDHLIYLQPASPWQQTQLTSLLSSTLSSFDISVSMCCYHGYTNGYITGDSKVFKSTIGHLQEFSLPHPPSAHMRTCLKAICQYC